jgi:hypothetical protein
VNRELRKTLTRAHDLLTQAYRLMEHVDREETDNILNVPPNLQGGNRSKTAGVIRNRQLVQELATLKAVMDTVKQISEGGP